MATRDQARAIGATKTTIRNLLRSGAWLPSSARVLRSSAAPVTARARVMAAVLDVSGPAWASHRTAAALWGVPGFDLVPPETIALHADRHVVGALGRVHRGRDLPARWLTVLDGIPVVRPELMVLQLCGSEHPGRAERALDNAWRRRLLSGRSVEALLADMGDRGRTGIGLLRELFAGRGVGYVPPASGLEARFESILDQHGLPPMARQVDLGDDEHWCGRVDYVHRPHRVVAEIDSKTYHSALLDRVADADRQRLLEAAGFDVVRLTDTQVWHRPNEVVEALEDAHRRFWGRNRTP